MSTVAGQVGNVPGRVLGWAAYLACSWTWCIGMFLPVLLMRDYGVWGFVVFAIPNCLGAAMSGMVMSRAGARAWFVHAHGPAARAFSVVTIAFQAFFAGWMVTVLPSAARDGVVLLALLPLFLRPARPGGLAVWTGVVIFAITVAALAANLGTGRAEFPTYVAPLDGRLLALAPVCAFGFALCPFLDLTFWRVGHEEPGRAGRAAFLAGFLALFPVSIAFTLAYAGRLGDAEEFASLHGSSDLPSTLLGVYVVAQLWATVAFHAGELAGLSGGRRLSPPHISRAGICGVLFIGGAGVLGAVGAKLDWYHGLAFNEVVYRVFMGAYGLLFPAYVWLCAMPGWRRSGGVSARNLRVWAATCAVATPMFWLGFIERREWWLLPAMGVVVLARLLVAPPAVVSGPGPGEPPEPSGAPVPVPSDPPPLSAREIPARGPQAGPDRHG